MGLPLAVGKALKLSAAGYVLSAILSFVLPYEFKGQLPVGNFITEQILFYIGSFVVILCWELCHHLHQVGLSPSYSPLSLYLIKHTRTPG